MRQLILSGGFYMKTLTLTWDCPLHLYTKDPQE